MDEDIKGQVVLGAVMITTALLGFVIIPSVLYNIGTDDYRAEIDGYRQVMEEQEYEAYHDLGSYYIIKDMKPGYLVVDKSTDNVFYREVHHDSLSGNDVVTMTPYIFGNDYLMYSLDESKYYVIRDDVKIYVNYN